MLLDGGDDAVQVIPDLVVAEPERKDPVGEQNLVAPLIVPRNFPVAAPVELDRELRCRTVKVEDVAVLRHLTLKGVARARTWDCQAVRSSCPSR